MSDQGQTTPADLVHQALRVLEMMTEEFTERLAEAFARDEVASRAWALSMIRLMKRDLSIVERDIEGELAEAMPERTLNVAGLLITRRRKSKREVFESSAILAKVVDSAATAAGVTLDKEERYTMVRVLSEALPITGSLAWRRAALDEMVPGWRHELFSAEDAGWSVSTQA